MFTGKTATAVLVELLFWRVVIGILHTFVYGLRYMDRDVLYGLSKYEANCLSLVMVIQFVNFARCVKNRFKMINSEIIRIFGCSDEIELDGYLVHTTRWHLTKPQGADINKCRRKKNLNFRTEPQ